VFALLVSDAMWCARRLVMLSITVVSIVIFAGSAEAYTYRHTVLPGDSLRRIAKRYHTTVRRIKRQNRRVFRRSQRLRAGSRLKIITSVPSRTIRKVRYTIKRKDTLSRIARHHKMKLWLLKRLNPRKSRKRLRVGSKLWVVVEGPRPSGGVGGLYVLESSTGYKVRNPRRSWGTLLAINRIHEVLTAHANRFPKSPPLLVMDLSRKGGGYFPPHKSHRQGRDVDIAYPKIKKYRRFVYLRPRMLDLKRTWDLVRSFIATKDVTYIFMNYELQRPLYRYARKLGMTKKQLKKVFQYPCGRRCSQGIVRHEPGHASHFHVRFRRADKKPKHTS
jgi:LysM repeat protein